MNLIFTVCVACIIQIWNKQKTEFKHVNFLKLDFQKSSADQYGVWKSFKTLLSHIILEDIFKWKQNSNKIICYNFTSVIKLLAI